MACRAPEKKIPITNSYHLTITEVGKVPMDFRIVEFGGQQTTALIAKAVIAEIDR